LNLRDKPLEEIHTQVQNLIEAISDLLTRHSLRNKIVKSFYSDEELYKKQQAGYTTLMGSSISLTQELSGTPCAKASKSLLSAVLGLLPIAELVDCAKSLLESNGNARDAIMSAISLQCRTMKSTHSADHVDALLSFIPNAILQISQAEEDAQILSAIDCIREITTRFGKKNPVQVNSAVEVIVGQRGLGSSKPEVLLVSLRTLSSITTVLREEILAMIPMMLEQCFNILLSNIESEIPNFKVQDACFSLLVSIAENIPFIMSGEKLDRVIQITQLSISRETFDNTVMQDQLYSTLASIVPAVEMYSAIQRNYDIARRKQSFDALMKYYGLIKSSVDNHSKGDAKRNAASLFKFISDAFELRSLTQVSSNEFQISPTEADDLEIVAIDIAIAFVAKINDVTFRPFFIQLVEWVSQKRNDATKEFTIRAITIFQFMKALLYHYKALVTNYVSYMLELTSTILTTTIAADAEASVLLQVAFGVLSLAFEHDESK
jgi:U3 small nucleolar RNA-associated protein 10